MALPTSTTEPLFKITRRYDADIDLMFRVWTQPAHLKHWFGPAGSEMAKCDMDLRPGGRCLFQLVMPDGGEMWGKFIYREVVPNTRLVWVHSFGDAGGNTVRHPMSETWPMEMLTAVAIEPVGEGTRVTVSMQPIDPTDAERANFVEGMGSMEQGWGGSLDILRDYLSELD